MAPEEPGSLVAIDLQFRDGRLRSEGERVLPRNGRLMVSWYSGGNPRGYVPISGGVVYVYDVPGIERLQIHEAEPTAALGRYTWRDVSRGEGLMFVMSLPEGFVMDDPKPMPIEAKVFGNRLAAFWLFQDGEERNVRVEWGLAQLQGDLQSEVDSLNSAIRLRQHVESGGVDFRYDVALSFAGEDRPYVEQVAKALRSRGLRIFYDDFEIVDLWGKNLYDHLNEVYRKLARYTVMFISTHYAQKVWPNYERQAAQARALAENREYILPARFDDSEVPGLLPTVAHVSLFDLTPEQLADLITKKVQSS